MKKVTLNTLLISSGIVSTTFLILFQEVNLFDLPLWLIWNLVISGAIYQISLFINKGASNELELKVHYLIQICTIIIGAYYTIIHHGPESEFRFILYNYFIFFIAYFILTVVGFIIVGLYGLTLSKSVKEEGSPTTNDFIELNETQLRAILHEALKNEDYPSADKIQKIIDKRFP